MDKESIFTKIIMLMRDEGEPLYLGEIVECLGLHWFVVKKSLDKMIKGGFITCNKRKLSAEMYSISCPDFWCKND